jgi:hypothetical protein
MNASPPANAVDVGALARCAALDLNPERRAAVEAVLSAWIPAANELSRKMSAPEHQTLLPATVFTHAPVDDEQA